MADKIPFMIMYAVFGYIMYRAARWAMRTVGLPNWARHLSAYGMAAICFAIAMAAISIDILSSFTIHIIIAAGVFQFSWMMAVFDLMDKN